MFKFKALQSLNAVVLTVIVMNAMTGDTALAQAPDNIVIQWNQIAIQAVRDTGLAPPMVARALAIVHTSIYDAWAAYDGVASGTQLGGSLRRPTAEMTAENKKRAISYAAYRALADLFPSRVSDFNAKMSSLGYDPADTFLDQITPTGIGNTAAFAVLNFRHHDGSNQLGELHPGAYSDYTMYQPINTPDLIIDPNRWQPLRFFNPTTGKYDIVRTYTVPFWGSVTPCAMTSGFQFRPLEGPARYPEGQYHAQVNEILHISSQLTDRQKMIAEYWADGPKSETPPGHWNLFAQFVSRRDNHTLDQDVKMFFALENALFDASIAAWDAKLTFDSERPITAIRSLKAGKPIQAWGGPNRGTIKMSGEQWLPYQPATFVTPPFPEFVSGHSTFSAAGAEVLRLFTGGDNFGASVTLPAGSSSIEPGTTPARAVNLSWATFSEAASEAGMSRLYGGIHFMDGNLKGQEMGRAIGALNWSKAAAYFRGNQ